MLPEPYEGAPNVKRRRDLSEQLLGQRVAVLSAVTALLMAVTVLLWGLTDRTLLAGSDSQSAQLLGLFAVAGTLGSILRSFAYLLAFRNLDERERRQWGLEAAVGLVLGAVAGVGVYFVVGAVLARGANAVYKPGQYLVSLAAGAAALGQVGKLAERGVLRSGLSRSGILGAEPSVTAPLLARLDRMLEQRVAELTVLNYKGYVSVRARRLGSADWRVDVVFDGRAGRPSTASPTPVEPHDVAVAPSPGRDAEVGWGSTAEARAAVVVAGGSDRDVVPFSLNVITEDFDVSPLSFSLSAPSSGRSVEVTFMLSGSTASTSDVENLGSLSVEISQGTQTVQLVPVRLADFRG
jgi:hypothetical protein